MTSLLRHTAMFTSLSYFVRNNKCSEMEYGNMLISEDKILIETCGNLKDSSRNTLTKIEKTNIGRLSAKVAHN